jgi:hypothetical protein
MDVTNRHRTAISAERLGRPSAPYRYVTEARYLWSIHLVRIEGPFGRWITTCLAQILRHRAVPSHRTLSLTVGVPNTVASRSSLQPQIVVHCDLDLLIGAEIALGRLDRRMAEQKLDLLEISSTLPAELMGWSAASTRLHLDIRGARGGVPCKYTRLLKRPWTPIGVTLPEEPFAPEVMARLIRMTGGNFRLRTRLLTQIERVLDGNNLQLISSEVVEAARDSLLIGQN